MKGLGLALVLLLAGCAAPAAVPSAHVAGTPALACASPCARVSIDGPVNEPWVAVDPNDARHVVEGGFGFAKGSMMPVAVTFDGGATWTNATLPAPPAPSAATPYSSEGDIMIAFANDGTVLVAGLVGRTAFVPMSSAGTTTIEIALWRSTDGGRTFPPGVVIRSETGAVAYTGAPVVHSAVAGAWDDKPFLVVDRATGESHLFWNVIDTGERSDVPLYEGSTDVMVMHSSDAGRTWSEPTRAASGIYGASAAAYNGTVLFTARSTAYELYRSTDAGRTFAPTTDLGPRPGNGQWQAAPVSLWPHDGALHALVAKVNGSKGEDVDFWRSVDGGATWTGPTRPFPTVDTPQRNPTMDVDVASGRGVLASYQGSGPATTIWTAALVDGVASNATQLAPMSAERYVYEYFGAAASARGAHVVWADRQKDASPLMDASLAWQG